jgi:hypothetical protein
MAEICGKVDAGPTYVHIDVLESGHTIKRLEMGGVKADSSIVVLIQRYMNTQFPASFPE